MFNIFNVRNKIPRFFITTFGLFSTLRRKAKLSYGGSHCALSGCATSTLLAYRRFVRF